MKKNNKKMYHVRSKRMAVWFMLPLLALLTACGGDEGTPVPSYAEQNGFEPAANDNSQTAQIRRSFYEKNGCYLLFNDTLSSHTTTGSPELLQIQYAIVGSISYSYNHTYTYDYITDVAEQQKAADAISHYLMSRLGSYKPFSFFLVDEISYENYGRTQHYDRILGLRSFVINLKHGKAYEDADAYFTKILVDIVLDALGKLDSEITDPFYAFSGEYYYEDIYTPMTEQEIWDKGMFWYYEDDGWGAYYYSQSEDLSEWLNVLMNMTPEEFEAKYGSSSVMMEKYKIFKQLIESQGFKLN